MRELLYCFGFEFVGVEHYCDWVVGIGCGCEHVDLCEGVLHQNTIMVRLCRLLVFIRWCALAVRSGGSLVVICS